ncbi:hypothetical protein LEP1GSC052_0237 [Leptospira kmetyi serovar Malaysia str. Bejo-Iso9]|nr:hypothetical protein LEP1GSC052_0237 [Leptospira kmetyi serovar Malaysia str. Bejo-Iso9]
MGTNPKRNWIIPIATTPAPSVALTKRKLRNKRYDAMEQRMSPKNVGVRRGLNLLNNPGTNKEDFVKRPRFQSKNAFKQRY